MNPEIEKINKSIDRLESKLYKLQKECPHENYKSEYGSNTGNYDPSSDCYWLNVKCLDCGKRMHFDSEEDNENYRKYRPK